MLLEKLIDTRTIKGPMSKLPRGMSQRRVQEDQCLVDLSPKEEETLFHGTSTSIYVSFPAFKSKEKKILREDYREALEEELDR